MTMYLAEFCCLCGHNSEDKNDFVVVEAPDQVICENTEACARRQKRDAILAEMKEMAKKPHVHPVDKFSHTSVAVCGFIMGVISVVCLAYILTGI